MAEMTAISWCDSTFNPWVGCTKVSPACDHCYAERLMDHRMHKVVWGAGQSRKRTGAANWRRPVLWEREHEAFALAHEGRRRRVFCASLADVFDNEAPHQWRVDLFTLIADTPHLDWLLLTKRIGNVRGDMLPPLHWPWPNVWLGATVVTQEEADRDIPKLLAVPAAKRFLSIEPMLGPINLLSVRPARKERFGSLRQINETIEVDALRGTRLTDMGFEYAAPRLDWIIAGGESGPHARPMHPDWVRSLRDQCAVVGVPFHFKQWGEWAPNCLCSTKTAHRDTPRPTPGKAGCMFRCGTNGAGRRLDGVEHNGAST